MSTNAWITVKTVKQFQTTVKRIYVHFDGDNLLKTLTEYYNTQEKAESVISEGDLSYLGVSMECPKGHNFNNPIPGYSVSYFRDRKGMDDTNKYPVYYDNIDQIIEHATMGFGTFIKWVYYWNGNRWTKMEITF